MRAIILQLTCLGLAFHGLDCQITRWTGPFGSTVSTALSGVAATDAASMYVSELTVSGSLVATAVAFPAGSVYTMAETTNTFKMATTGEIYLMCSTLDYTYTATSYTLTITATTPGGTGTLTLTVNVNATPEVTGGKLCSCSIATGTLPGTTLTTYTVTDENIGDSRTYALSGNTVDWTLSSPAGILSTRATLDNTIKSCYVLTATITDNGGLAAETSNTASVNSTVTVSVGAVDTETSCSCTDGAAAIVGGMILLLAGCMAIFM